ncbi:MAG TPA: site-specific DNA-methyltransferase [Methanofastidiosum sp.]|nr:site-specific DNA-methyltransferase [Methanofastidiosum sp.]
MKDIPDKSIDMILCDLPYGTTACKWDVVIPFEPLWEQYKRIIKDNGAIVLTAQCSFDKVLGASNLEMLRYEWIWQKEQGTGGGNANKMPLKDHENILVFYRKLPIYNPQFSAGKPYKVNRKKPNLLSVYGKTGFNESFLKVNTGQRYPKTVIKFNKEYGLHPTQKPVALLEYLIKTYTNENETVLDNCMGSGSTGVACINTNRNFIGIEKDDKYFEIAKSRIEKA